jgi:hypothetical protein
VGSGYDPDIYNGRTMPHWWGAFRRVIIFLLGVAIIIDSLTDADQALGKLIAGLLMVGVFPIEDLIGLIVTRIGPKRNGPKRAD